MAEWDFIQREIEGLSRLLAKTVFGKSSSISLVTDDGVISSKDFLKFTLFDMLAKGEINEAENLLHTKMEEEPCSEYFAAGIEFYSELNKISDFELEECDFSREEIADGVEALRMLL